MVLVALVDSSGTGIFLTGSVIFLTRPAGLTAGQIGVGLSIGGIVGFASTVARLRKENAELALARDVLKRSVVLWAKEAMR